MLRFIRSSKNWVGLLANLGFFVSSSAFAVSFDCSTFLTTRRHTLTREDAAEVVVTALARHITQREWTTVIERKVQSGIPEILDPRKILLARSDMQGLLEPGPEVANQIVRYFDGELGAEIGALTEFRTQARSALQAARDFLVKTPGLRARVYRMAEQPAPGYHAEFAQSREQVHDKLAQILARSVRKAKQHGISKAEAYLLEFRDFQRYFANISEMLKEESQPTLLLKSFMLSLDPHSTYLAKDEWQELNQITKKENTVAGIGVNLSEVASGTQIQNVNGEAGAGQAGLRVGDIITYVDNTPVRGMDVDSVAELIKGQPESSVNLKVRRSGQDFDLTVNRTLTVNVENETNSTLLPTKFGPVVLMKFHRFYDGVITNAVEDLHELFSAQAVQGVVVDLRDNGGGLVNEAFNLLNLLINEGLLYTRDDTERPTTYYADPKSIKFVAPVIILVNERTASAAELAALVLQDYGRAIVVGASQSYGKGSAQTLIPIEKMGGIKLTLGLLYSASGKSAQLTGVHPDIVLADVAATTQLEKFRQGAIEPLSIRSSMKESYPYMPGHAQVVDTLNDLSRQRRALDPAWAKIKSSSDLSAEDALVEKEAAAIMEDLLALMAEFTPR